MQIFKTSVLQIVTLALALSPVFSFADANLAPTREQKPDPVVVQPPKDQVPKSLLALTSTSPYAFVVDKAQRTLTVWKWDNDTVSLVAAYPTDIGRAAGDKKSQGDHRTPEGVYFFQEALEGPGLDFNQYGVRAFTTDYPNFFDRLDKKTGNGIWLHAIPETQSLLRGSRGCVVVRNNVVQELAKYVQLKSTPMIVLSNVEYVSLEDWKKGRAEFLVWLDKWRAAWESKNLDQYMTFYDENFASLGMNRKEWQDYKKNLNENYNFIKVSFKEVQAFKHQDRFVVRFLQSYQSDKKQDVGEKVLYLKASAQGLGIVGETWAPRRDAMMAFGG